MTLLLFLYLAVPACSGFLRSTTGSGGLQCFLERTHATDSSKTVASHRRLQLCANPKSRGDDAGDLFNDSGEKPGLSRRHMLVSTLAGATTGLFDTLPADASIPEIDTFGNLFTPKTDMLAGGSTAARGGVALPRRRQEPSTLGPSLYETRFVAYLARFLLNFDPSARAYWNQQGFGFSWDATGDATNVDDTAAFAAFAESVEVGLADYFSGPFGSYSTVTAAVAGISASEPARSKFASKRNKEQKRQGVLNLYSLLKARYNSISAKRQLAVLFSFVSDPDLQPTKEIRQLLGETDNAAVTEIRLTGSVRNRGGYALDDPPVVAVDDPPPLGDKYKRATARPILKPTTRVLRIDVVDAGEGYKTAPAVSVYSFRPVLRQCQATAILDRFGHIESIIVLDSGLGYYDSKSKPPRVQIEAPPRPGRKARAVLALEQEIVGVTVESGGNGFVATEQPSVSVSAPRQLPDWHVDVKTSPTMQMIQPTRDALGAEVTEMSYADGNLAYSASGVPRRSFVMTDEFINKIGRDPLELLPSSVRPELVPRNGKYVYSVVPLAGIPQYVAVLAPRYRAYDPVFGGVGILPVTKGAAALTASEYARLALSGAVCTVVVRTLLNPLELIKTKQQLENDDELLNFARYGDVVRPGTSDDTPIPPTRLSVPTIDAENISVTEPAVSVETRQDTSEATVAVAQDDEPIGTSEMIRAMVKLRGVSSLFQSLDITFLASIPFGSFGFGATELFRRSFTEFFASGDGSEIPLLLAASAATVITAAAMSPFEVLRVRSMGLIEPKPWNDVLEQFLVSGAFVAV